MELRELSFYWGMWVIQVGHVEPDPVLGEEGGWQVIEARGPNLEVLDRDQYEATFGQSNLRAVEMRAADVAYGLKDLD